MADTSSTTPKYPLPSYQYQVGIKLNGTPTTMSFATVTGLTIRYNYTVYKESMGDNDKKVRSLAMPAQMDKSNPIVFSRGIINSGTADDLLYLYAWIANANYKTIDKREITVNLCNEMGDAVVTWTLRDAFPIRLDAPTFDASSNNPAIESLQVLVSNIEMTKAS
ncbi:MAG: phage tail protein [Candidatus Methylumidiphilus sp.]